MNRLFLLPILLLAACATTTPATIDILDNNQIPIPPLPQKPIINSVHWTVSVNGKIVLYGLSEAEFKKLVSNLESLQQYILESNQVIQYYIDQTQEVKSNGNNNHVR